MEMAAVTKEDVERKIEQTIHGGGVEAMLYFDVHGNSKEMVHNSMVAFVGKLSKETGVVYAFGKIPEVEFINEMWTTSAEVTVIMRSFEELVDLSFKYSPIGVEILQPSEIHLSLNEAQKVLLNAANSSQEFSNYIMEKVLKPSELAEYRQKLERKAELGKRLMEKSSKVEEES